MSLLLLLIVDGGCIWLTTLFFYRAIKQGFIDKRVIEEYPDTYVEGRRAVGYGIMYVVFGLVTLALTGTTSYVLLYRLFH